MKEINKSQVALKSEDFKQPIIRMFFLLISLLSFLAINSNLNLFIVGLVIGLTGFLISGKDDVVLTNKALIVKQDRVFRIISSTRTFPIGSIKYLEYRLRPRAALMRIVFEFIASAPRGGYFTLYLKDGRQKHIESPASNTESEKFANEVNSRCSSQG